MKIIQTNQLEKKIVEMEGVKDVTMQILIGPDQGSPNIIMRKFSVAVGGHTPYHTHEFEHVVKVESGIGALLDSEKNQHPLAVGQNAFVSPYEPHQFINTGETPFEFLCIIPNPDKDCG